MEEFFATFLPLAIAAYIISIGFGMLLAQGRGVATVNRFWMRSIRSIARGAFRLIGRFFNWVASLFKIKAGQPDTTDWTHLTSEPFFNKEIYSTSSNHRMSTIDL